MVRTLDPRGVPPAVESEQRRPPARAARPRRSPPGVARVPGSSASRIAHACRAVSTARTPVSRALVGSCLAISARARTYSAGVLGKLAGVDGSTGRRRAAICGRFQNRRSEDDLNPSERRSALLGMPEREAHQAVNTKSVVTAPHAMSKRTTNVMRVSRHITRGSPRKRPTATMPYSVRRMRRVGTRRLQMSHGRRHAAGHQNGHQSGGHRATRPSSRQANPLRR
jgi:hypothetical protein